MAQLLYSAGDAPRTVGLDGNLVVVGSDAACGLRLEGADVSPVHCELRRGPEGWRVVDLESRTGTCVNGEFVNTKALRDGDVLDVGGVQMQFRGDATPARPVVAPPDQGLESLAVTPQRGPVAPQAPQRAAPQRSAPRRAGSSGRNASREGSRDEEGGGAADAKRNRRLAKSADKATTTMYMVAGGAGMILVIWLLFHFVGSGTPNHNLRVRMAEAKSQMKWQQVIDLGAQADHDDSFDDKEMTALVEYAKKALRGEATGVQVDQSIKDWTAIRVWRQENFKENDEFLQRIDEYLTRYAGLESEGTKQAKADRVKLTGTSAVAGTATTGDAAWRIALDDAHAREQDGRFSQALDVIDAYWKANERSAPTMITGVQAEKKRILAAADGWFAKQVAMAKHYWIDNNEKTKARRTLEAAATKIGLPGYADRASEELTKLQSGEK